MNICPCCGKPKRPKNLDGLGTALKPAVEFAALLRKPLALPTVAGQVMATGTGALNIDACRVGTTVETWPTSRRQYRVSGVQPGGGIDGGTVETGAPPAGRWPANVLHDGSPEVLEAFARYGERRSPKPYIRGAGSASKSEAIYGDYRSRDGGINASFGDTGTAARFFPALGFTDEELRFHYSAKASKRDRAGSKHPTVKPVALMRWLVRMVTPPGGVILDPFAGSGTTGQAAREEGFDAILIEREAEYVADIRNRLGRDLFAGAA